jgi:hypothetical protein
MWQYSIWIKCGLSMASYWVLPGQSCSDRWGRSRDGRGWWGADPVQYITQPYFPSAFSFTMQNAKVGGKLYHFLDFFEHILKFCKKIQELLRFLIFLGNILTMVSGEFQFPVVNIKRLLANDHLLQNCSYY